MRHCEKHVQAERDGHKSMSSTMAKKNYEISLFEMKNDEFRCSNVNSTFFFVSCPFLQAVTAVEK